MVMTRLPGELRNMIYDILLTGDVLEAIREPMRYLLDNENHKATKPPNVAHPVPFEVDSEFYTEVIRHYYTTGKYPLLLAFEGLFDFITGHIWR